MLLTSISLTNFRNYSKAAFVFSPQTTLVVGPNTSGKTNLLEAIYFLATGRSFRATHDREAIREGEVFARVVGVKGVKGIKGIKEGDDETLELTILANENGENTSSKRFKVNGVKKRLSDFAGNLRAVYFGPEEILLVTGSPSRRRKYLDSVLVQVDREYARALLEYEKVLRQRNRLLLILREKGIKGIRGVNEQLDFWDEKLYGLSEIISGKRALLVDSLNRGLEGKLKLIVYQSKRPHVGIYDLREREIAAGMTLWGPHREDFVFEIKNQKSKIKDEDGRDLSRFGSRGEQRLAVLHLKLAELEFISEKVGERPPFAKASGGKPILLLDDIFSELDEGNRGRVLSLLGKQQTIITTTDLDQVDGGKLGQHEVLQLQ